MKASLLQKNMCNSKAAQSIGEEKSETASSKTFLIISMLTDIAKLKSEARAIKETYILKCHHFDVALKKIADQNNFSEVCSFCALLLSSSIRFVLIIILCFDILDHFHDIQHII